MKNIDTGMKMLISEINAGIKTWGIAFGWYCFDVNKKFNLNNEV